jgi:hypothetical protein
MPCLEPVLITRPGAPRSTIPGTKAWQPLMTPQRLTRSTACQVSAGPNIELPGWMPALFMSTCTAPNRSSTAASRRFTEAASPQSVGTATASPGPAAATAARA